MLKHPRRVILACAVLAGSALAPAAVPETLLVNLSERDWLLRASAAAGAPADPKADLTLIAINLKTQARTELVPGLRPSVAIARGEAFSIRVKTPLGPAPANPARQFELVDGRGGTGAVLSTNLAYPPPDPAGKVPGQTWQFDLDITSANPGVLQEARETRAILITGNDAGAVPLPPAAPPAAAVPAAAPAPAAPAAAATVAAAPAAAAPAAAASAAAASAPAPAAAAPA